MALDPALNSGLDGGGVVAVAGSGYAKWFLAHDNANGAADGGTDPLAITQTGARWINVPRGATRLYLRAAWTNGGTVSTEPIVRVWGCDRTADDGTKPAAGAQIERLAVDTTLTGTKIVDATWDDDGDGTATAYDFGATSTGIDMLGARSILIEVTTAQSGAAACKIQGKFLN